MISSRSGLKALCLCAVALGVMAFSASAQASTWMVGGANLTSGERAVVASIVPPSASLLTKIAGVHVKFTCSGGTLVNVALKPEGKLTEGGKVKFTGCTTTLKTKKEEEKAEGGKVSGPCEPFTGTEKGVIVTEEGKGQLTEHSTGEGVTVVKPLTGETLAVIHMGAECSIGSEVPVIGQLGIVDSGGMGGLLTPAKVHTIQEGPLTELWTISKTEEHKAKIEGKAEVNLVSAETWNGKLP